eukprot:44372-Amphidinium_carterae.1
MQSTNSAQTAHRGNGHHAGVECSATGDEFMKKTPIQQMQSLWQWQAAHVQPLHAAVVDYLLKELSSQRGGFISLPLQGSALNSLTSLMAALTTTPDVDGGRMHAADVASIALKAGLTPVADGTLPGSKAYRH